MSIVSFVVCLPDGNIIRSGTCDESIVDDQLIDEGERVLVGEGEVGTHYVVGDSISAYTAEQLAARKAFPPRAAVWDNATMAWILQEFPLEQEKSAAWTKIKARREVAFFAHAVSSIGIAYSIGDDKANLADRLASLSAAVSLGLATTSTPVEWRDRDNVAHTLTIVGLQLLAAEMGARGQAIYEHSWALDAQVHAAPDKETLALVDLDAGWP